MFLSKTYISTALSSLLILAPFATALGEQRTIDVPIAVRFTGKADSLSWQVEPNENILKKLGVLREGDKISISIVDSKELTLAQSETTYRWKSGKSCRKRFMRSSKCTVTYANEPCRTPMTENPVDGSMSIAIHFNLDVKKGSEISKKHMGGGVGSISYEPKVPVQMRLSGGLEKPLAKCNRPMKGSITKGPVLFGEPLGKSSPAYWFNIRVHVIPPELVD